MIAIVADQNGLTRSHEAVEESIEQVGVDEDALTLDADLARLSLEIPGVAELI